MGLDLEVFNAIRELEEEERGAGPIRLEPDFRPTSSVVPTAPAEAEVQPKEPPRKLTPAERSEILFNAQLPPESQRYLAESINPFVSLKRRRDLTEQRLSQVDDLIFKEFGKRFSEEELDANRESHPLLNERYVIKTTLDSLSEEVGRIQEKEEASVSARGKVTLPQAQEIAKGVAKEQYEKRFDLGEKYGGRPLGHFFASLAEFGPSVTAPIDREEIKGFTEAIGSGTGSAVRYFAMLGMGQAALARSAGYQALKTLAAEGGTLAGLGVTAAEIGTGALVTGMLTAAEENVNPIWEGAKSAGAFTATMGASKMIGGALTQSGIGEWWVRSAPKVAQKFLNVPLKYAASRMDDFVETLGEVGYVAYHEGLEEALIQAPALLALNLITETVGEFGPGLRFAMMKRDRSRFRTVQLEQVNEALADPETSAMDRVDLEKFKTVLEDPKKTDALLDGDPEVIAELARTEEDFDDLQIVEEVDDALSEVEETPAEPTPMDIDAEEIIDMSDAEIEDLATTLVDAGFDTLDIVSDGEIVDSVSLLDVVPEQEVRPTERPVEIKKTEVKEGQVKPSKVKPVVREVTGQKKEAAPIETTEERLLKEKLTTEERAARKGFVAGKKVATEKERTKSRERLAEVRAKLKERKEKAVQKTKEEEKGKRERLVERKKKLVERIKERQAERESKRKEKEKRRRLISRIKNIQKSAKKNLNENQRNAINELLQDIELEKFSAKKFQRYNRFLNNFIETLDENERATFKSHIEEARRINNRMAVDKDQVSTEELEELYNAIQHQVNLSQLKSSLRRKREKKTRERLVQRVTDQLNVSLDDMESGFMGGEKVGILRRLKNFVDLHKLNLLDKHVIADIFERDPDGVIHDLLINNFNDAEARKAEILEKYRDPIMIDIASNEKLRNDLDELHKINKSLELTGNQAVEIYMHLDNAKAFADLTRGGIVRRVNGEVISEKPYKMTEADIDAVVGIVEGSPDLQKFANDMGASLDAMFEELNDVYKRLFGNRVDLIREDSYFPIKVAREFLSQKTLEESIEAYITSRYGADYITFDKGIFKMRKARGAPIFIDGAMTSFVGHMDNASNLVAFEEPLQRANTVFNRTDIKQMLSKQYGGNQINKRIRKVLVDVVGEIGRPTDIDKAVAFIRKNVTTADIAPSVPAMLKQTLSFANTLPYLKPSDMVAGMTKVFGSISSRELSELTAEWEGRSKFIKNRFRKGFDVTLQDIIDSQDLLRSLGFSKSKLPTSLADLRAKAFFGIRGMDKITILAIAEGAKNKVLRESSNLDAEQLDRAIQKEADRIIRRTQIASSRLDRAPVLNTQSELVKALTVFYGAQSKILNASIGKIYADYKRTGNKKEMVSKLMSMAAPMLMINFIGSIGITAFINHLWGYISGDDEEEKKSLASLPTLKRIAEERKKPSLKQQSANAVIEGLGSLHPVLRMFIRPVSRGLILGETYWLKNFNNPILRPISRLFDQLSKIKNKKDKANIGAVERLKEGDKEFKEAMDLLIATMNVPAKMGLGIPMFKIANLLRAAEQRLKSE